MLGKKEASNNMKPSRARCYDRACSIRKCLPLFQSASQKSVRERRTFKYGSVLSLALVASLFAYANCGCDFAIDDPMQLSVPTFLVSGSRISPRCQCMYTCNATSDDAKHCSCHPYCYMFDSCCEDVRPANWQELMLPPNQYTCASPVPWVQNVYDFQPNHKFYTHNTGSLIINQCPSCSNSSCYVEQLCQHPLALTQDGVLSIPVTANTTGLTYRNIFCALCHGENVSDVVEWTQVLITIPQSYGYDSLGGSVRIGFQSPFDAPILECRRNLVQRCAGVAPNLSYPDACQSLATRYAYDNKLGITYRKWNCSKCNNNPVSTCIFTQVSYGRWSRAPPTARAMAIERDWRCPSRLEAFMSEAEKQFWLSRCPALRLPDPSCASFVNATELSRLFAAETGDSATAAAARSSADYGVASDYAWLRRDNSSNSSVVCSSCRTQYYPTYGRNLSTNVSGNFSGDVARWNASDAELFVGAIAYSRPFFTTQTAACYVVVCGELQPPAYLGNWTPTRYCRKPPQIPAPPDAGAATAAAGYSPPSVWTILVGVALAAARGF